MTVINQSPKGVALDLLVAGCTTPLMLGYLLNPIPFYPHCEASPFDTDSELLPIIGLPGILAHLLLWNNSHDLEHIYIHELNHQLLTFGSDIF